MTTVGKDWTEESPDNFVFHIASDFTDKLEERMDELGISQTALADRLSVSKGRVSQLLNDPGNLTLEMIVRCARAVGIKVGLLAYDDGDHENLHGPIIPEVFLQCWEKSGKPKSLFDLCTAWTHAVSSPDEIIQLSIEKTADTLSLAESIYLEELSWLKAPDLALHIKS